VRKRRRPAIFRNVARNVAFAKVMEIGGTKLEVEVRVGHYSVMQRSRPIKEITGAEHRVRIDVTYKGPLNRELDKKIRSAFGGRTDGSGFYFGGGGIRDIGRTFKKPNDARLARERLRKIRKIKIRIFEGMPEALGVRIYVGPKRRF